MAAPNTTPTLLNRRYHLLDRLGSGGMGAVYRAADRLTNQHVALKQVALDNEGSTVSGSALNSSSVDFRVALAQEFRILASLRHPNIIDVLDYGFDSANQPYFTMTLLPKPQSMVVYARAQSFEGQIDLLIQLFQALSYLHRQRVVHCDIKPGNVLVSGGTVKVLDFGLALVSQKQQRDSDRIAGTLAYMSPETLRGEPPTPQADLYAAGVMLYEIFAGHYPFYGGTTTQLMENILNTDPDYSKLNFTQQIAQQATTFSPTVDLGRLNERMIKIVGGLLSRDLESRYQNAETVIAALYEALGRPIPDESVAIRESFLQASLFVGRKHELEILESALVAAKGQQGEAWLVGGESGVGKTRLLEELGHQAIIQGTLVLHGAASMRSTLTYQFWRVVLRPLLLLSDVDTLTASILKTLVPDIGTLMNRGVPDAPPLEGAAWQLRLVLAIVDAFSACKTPILLIVEDMQWLAENLEPLQMLIRLAPTLPLLIVGSYRSDEYPDLPASVPGMRPLPLDRLSMDDIRELSTAILGMPGTQPKIVELLNHETEGNAFFLVETIRTLALQAGRLTEIAAMPIPPKILPEGINGLLQTRLARISEAGQRLLRYAALGGRQLDLAVLDRIATKNFQPSVKLNLWLTECVNAALINRQHNRWNFIHDKLRQLLISDLSPEQYALYNQHFAEAFEYIYPENYAYSRVLTDLWHDAGDRSKEYFYALLAGQRALSEANPREATQMGQRAIQITTTQNLEAVPVFQLLGDAYWTLSNYPDAKINYRACLETARAWGDRAYVIRALRGLGDVAWRESKYTDSQAYFEEALKLTTGMRHEEMHILGSLGWVAVHQGDYPRARTLYEQSLALCRAAGVLIGTAETLRGLGEVHLQLRDYESARHCYDEGMALARLTGDRRTIAALCRGLGEVAQYQGDFAYAQVCFEELRDIMAQMGDQRGLSMALYGLGVVAIQRSDYDIARAAHTEGLALCRAIGAKRGITTNLCNLAFIEIKCQNLILAESYLYEALLIGEQTKDIPVRLNALSVYVWLFSAQGMVERSAALYRLVTSRPETPTYAIQLIAPVKPDPAVLATLPELTLESAIADIFADTTA
jgi:tetratricopeptide (TPR) repeat protein